MQVEVVEVDKVVYKEAQMEQTEQMVKVVVVGEVHIKVQEVGMAEMVS